MRRIELELPAIVGPVDAADCCRVANVAERRAAADAKSNRTGAVERAGAFAQREQASPGRDLVGAGVRVRPGWRRVWQLGPPEAAGRPAAY
jgi:hypothetical protein